MSAKDIVLAFAQKNGFDKVKQFSQWNGYTVYAVDNGNQKLTLGAPFFFLEKDGNVRFTEGEEAYDILRSIDE